MTKKTGGNSPKDEDNMEPTWILQNLPIFLSLLIIVIKPYATMMVIFFSDICEELIRQVLTKNADDLSFVIV